MKYPYCCILLLMLPAAGLAQHGTVHYDYTVATDIEMPDEVKNMKIDGLREAFANMPEEFTTRCILHFDANASLMEVSEDDAETPRHKTIRLDSDGAAGRMQVAFRARGLAQGAGTAVATFVNFDESTFVQQHDFMGRTFLVSGTQEPLAWKLPGEERTLLGYHLVKATAVRDSLDIEAWFAPEIPAPGGPGLYGGLPGLILVLSIDDGRKVYTAVELDLDRRPDFERPTKGRKVSQEKYDRIVAAKLEERQKTRGGGNRVVIDVRKQ